MSTTRLDMNTLDSIMSRGNGSLADALRYAAACAELDSIESEATSSDDAKTVAPISGATVRA